MATLVTNWSSKLGHITDDSNNETVKTRCGRTLKNFHYEHSRMNECTRCGSEEDYKAIRIEMRQRAKDRQLERELNQKKRQLQNEKRLVIHRQLMAQFQEMLQEAGVSITNVHEAPAGGTIEFMVDGLKFKLNGNIW